MNKFKVGTAYKIITPPLGTPLYGYAFQRAATAVADDLRVNAIAFENGDVKGIIISADIVSAGYDLADRIRDLVSKETDVPAMNVSFSATHTHSGPAIKTGKGWGTANVEYIENILVPQTILAAKEAVNKLDPALMGVGTTKSYVGINRREMLQDGSVILGQNPYGPFDPIMTVVSFASAEGKPLANIIHYGAHGTSAGRNPEITRDWMGVMVDRLEKETGAMTMFVNGAEGDVGPRLSNGQTTGDTKDWTKTDIPTGDIGYVYELGSVAAIDAMTAYRSIKDYSEVEFRTESGTLILPYDKMHSYEYAKKRFEELDTKDVLVEVENREHAKFGNIVKMYEEGKEFDTQMEVSQTIFAFNDVAFVPFRFEMFSEIALRLKTYSPYKHTLCLSNTNGSDFYLPTRSQMVMGGYEIDIFCLGSVYKLVDNIDDIIINENMKILSKMKPFTVCKKERFV